jgi:hypothetical protein
MQNWISALSLLLLMVSAVGLQAARERSGGLASVSADVLYIRSPEAMKRLALSYDDLLADIYWIRAVQHYGSIKLADGGDKSYNLLYPLLDLTTSLDERFNVAYYFGSLFLAEPAPGGPGRPDLAIALLQKGLVAQPTKWEFVQAIGFVHYWYFEDYPAAAEWFERAAKMPGAPVWMGSLAAVTLAEGGHRDRSRTLWQQVAATAAYTRERGAPRTWDELIAAGFLRGVPPDPTGRAYRLTGGGVSLDPSSTLLPLPHNARSRR